MVDELLFLQSEVEADGVFLGKQQVNGHIEKSQAWVAMY
jgi:hypothetical protein